MHPHSYRQSCKLFKPRMSPGNLEIFPFKNASCKWHLNTETNKIFRTCCTVTIRHTDSSVTDQTSQVLIHLTVTEQNVPVHVFCFLIASKQKQRNQPTQEFLVKALPLPDDNQRHPATETYSYIIGLSEAIAGKASQLQQAASIHLKPLQPTH